MTAPAKARHRKATRPSTPWGDVAPATRRGLVVAASSGLAATLLISGADAVGQDAQALRNSAGTLKVGPVAHAEDAATRNVAIRVSADVAVDTDVSSVDVSATPAADEANVAAAVDDNAVAPVTVTEAPIATEGAPASSSGNALVDYGMQFIGTPYVWGASGPGGFDCSGFVSYVYASAGVSLPHQSSAIRAAGTPVSAAEAQPGDVLWWPGHVGLYAGNGMLLEASDGGIRYGAIWGSPTYLRIL